MNEHPDVYNQKKSSAVHLVVCLTTFILNIPIMMVK
jgi:hypothetical protein